MGRVVRFGCGAALLVIVVLVALSVAGLIPNSRDALALTYLNPSQRRGDYAAFAVRFKNGSKDDIVNPQTHMVVELGGREWSCQGYEDPMTGEPISEVGDIITRPLVLAAGAELPVTILCRIPEAPLDSARVRLR